MNEFMLKDTELFELLEHSQYLRENNLEEEADKFDEDIKNRPLLALYLMKHHFNNRDHLMNTIMLDAKTKRTQFDGVTCLSSALYRKLNDKHVIEVQNKKEDISIRVEAYHINSNELNILNELIRMENKHAVNNEGEEYEIQVFISPKDIKVERCDAGMFIGSSETIEDNQFSSDCDTYGSMYGSKARRNFHYFNIDTNEYVVLYYAYWCL